MLSDIRCEEVRREISNYIEDDLPAELRVRLEGHLQGCAQCVAILEGARNVMRLVRDEKFSLVPEGFSKRLRTKWSSRLQTATIHPDRGREIPLGITDDPVPLGAHLIYFWQTEGEFQRGIRFLELGVNQGEHCVLFGHDEANDRVLEILRRWGCDIERARQEQRLTILRRSLSAQETLASIEEAFVAAMQVGASAIRYLGNLGMGQAPLPGRGVDEVLQLENGATLLAEQYPCVIVCMYDVNTLSGQLLWNGGFHTHPLAICAHALQPNAYYTAESSRGAVRVQ